jgi:hypothetical protein
MRDFGPVLRGLEAGLRLPAGRRTRVLLEVGQDLEDLIEAYRARGMDAVQARARAEALLGPTSESAAELTALHAPWWAALLGVSAVRADALWAASPAASVALVTAFATGVLWSLLLWLRVLKRSDVPVTADATMPVAGLALLLGATSMLAASLELQELAEAVVRAGEWHVAVAVAALGRAAHMLALGLSTMLVVLLLWAPLYRLARRTDAERAQIRAWSGPGGGQVS